MDNTRPPRPTLTAPGSVRAAVTDKMRTFAEKPAYQKPSYDKPSNFRPQGGGFKGGPRRKTDADDPDLIRTFPRALEKGQTEKDRIPLSVRRDSIGWVTPASSNPQKITLIGLRNASASAIPVETPFAEVDLWWKQGYPLTLKR